MKHQFVYQLLDDHPSLRKTVARATFTAAVVVPGHHLIESGFAAPCVFTFPTQCLERLAHLVPPEAHGGEGRLQMSSTLGSSGALR